MNGLQDEIGHLELGGPDFKFVKGSSQQTLVSQD
jgi:hypothetical protein